MSSSMHFLTQSKAGGPIMIPLLLCSLGVWAVAFLKWKSIQALHQEIQLLAGKIPQLIQEKKLHEAKGLCHTVALLGPAMEAVLTGSGQGGHRREQWQSKVQRRLSESMLKAKQGAWMMGTVGALAPFIGLFGTVVGIISSFESISSSGKSGFSVVAAGLSEALVATAAGIAVAVMAVALYNYFQNKFSQVQIKARHLLEDLMDLLEQGHGL